MEIGLLCWAWYSMGENGDRTAMLGMYSMGDEWTAMLGMVLNG